MSIKSVLGILSLAAVIRAAARGIGGLANMDYSQLVTWAGLSFAIGVGTLFAAFVSLM